MSDKSKENMVKARLLVLTKMFYELTDENHPMDTFEIIDYLAEQGVPANTKTLRSDIKLLKDQDIDIVTISSKPNKYFLGARLFEIPEIKLLLDAVASSRFITKSKSKELSRKLTSLTSDHQRKQLNRHMYTTGRVKPGNENVFYYVDLINDLMIPFRNKDYYNKAMQGSYSIKYVLPALFPDDPSLDYHNLEGIHNGAEASAAFAAMSEVEPKELNNYRQYLLKYCEL